MSPDEINDGFDVTKAREMAYQVLRSNSSASEDDTEFCVEVAERVDNMILRQIKRAAEHGETGTEFRFKNRGIPKDYLEEVIQIVKLRLDERGFNIISYIQPSFFGSTTVFEIEW